MATENLQIPDIAASQNQKEVTANAAHNLLDRALNNNAVKSISGDTSFTTTEARENFVIELTGTPGAPLNLDMPDTNNRTLTIVNNTDDIMTIRNSASGGAGQPVIAVGGVSTFHYDGVNFFDFSALALAVASWIGLTDTPSAYTNFGGQQVTVDAAETGVEFTAQHAKIPVRVATTVAGTLASDFEDGDTVDGVVLAEFDRILIKDQSAGSENGIHVVASSGAPTRAIDFDDNADVILGETIPVLLGDANARSVWMHTAGTDIGTDTLTFLKTEPAVGYMPLSLGSLRDLATDEISTPLDDTTTPRLMRVNGATDKAIQVLWATSNNDEVAFPEIYMPPDFDSDKDITIHIVGEMSGATDTPTIDVLVFDSSGDTEMGGVTATFTDTRAEKTVTISAADLTGHPLGWLSISLIPVGAHATDTLAVHSVWIEYTRKVA